MLLEFILLGQVLIQREVSDPISLLDRSLVITGSTVHLICWAGELIVGLAPSLGASMAAGMYILLKQLNYDEVNGTADRDDTSPLMRTPLEIHHISPANFPVQEGDRESHKERDTFV